MESLQRTRLLSVGVLAVVLGAGVVLGLALDVRLDAAGSDDGEPTEEVRNDEHDGGRSERRPPMYRQVGELTDEQDERIDSIIDVHRDAMRQLQREFSEAYDPRYWAIIENTRESIKGVLTPGQAERYDSLLTRYDGRRPGKDEDAGGGER